ncbi:MAG: nitroreductase [Porticoccaceae bacterium]
MENQAFIDGLHNRTSCAQLEAPAPSEAQLEVLFKAAFRAADHRQLKPWRFLVIEDAGLNALGELFLSAKDKAGSQLTEEDRIRTRSLPKRAPMVIVAIASIREDPKVPATEQLLATAAAVQNMLNAAFAMGLGAIWRTGDLAENPDVATGLGLASNEKMVAFLYLGTPKIPFRLPPAPDIKNHVSQWP